MASFYIYCLKIKTTRSPAFSLFHSSFSPRITFAIHLDRAGEYSPSNPDHFLTSPSLVNITLCCPRESEFCSYANSFVFQFLPKKQPGWSIKWIKVLFTFAWPREYSLYIVVREPARYLSFGHGNKIDANIWRGWYRFQCSSYTTGWHTQENWWKIIACWGWVAFKVIRVPHDRPTITNFFNHDHGLGWNHLDGSSRPSFSILISLDATTPNCIPGVKFLSIGLRIRISLHLGFRFDISQPYILILFNIVANLWNCATHFFTAKKQEKTFPVTIFGLERYTPRNDDNTD